MSPDKLPADSKRSTAVSDNLAGKSQALEAIKKEDTILLEKTISKLKVHPSSIVGPPELKKSLLHAICESNFSEGM